MIIAALYTKKVKTGGKQSKSMSRVPVVKGSTALVMDETTLIREVLANELKLSVTIAEEEPLVPSSNAKRSALSKHQHRYGYTGSPIYEAWRLTYGIDPVYQSRCGLLPASPRLESSAGKLTF